MEGYSRIGYVTRDQKVLGSNPVWVAAVNMLPLR